MKEETQEQHNKQRNYDWLKAYQFVKGVSGNPGGRPKGAKSLKTFAREFLESLPDDEKVEYLKTLPTEIVWKMAEGNPQQSDDITSGGRVLPTPIININGNLSGNHSNKEDSIVDEKN